MNSTTNQNERIQLQIGVSIGLARTLVSSWLPPLTEEEKRNEKEISKKTDNVLAKRRTPKAGLGSAGEKNEQADLSVEELRLQRKLLQKEKRVREQAKEKSSQQATKHRLASIEDSEDEDGSRRKGTKRSKVLGSNVIHKTKRNMTGSGR